MSFISVAVLIVLTGGSLSACGANGCPLFTDNNECEPNASRCTGDFVGRQTCREDTCGYVWKPSTCVESKCVQLSERSAACHPTSAFICESERLDFGPLVGGLYLLDSDGDGIKDLSFFDTAPAVAKGEKTGAFAEPSRDPRWEANVKAWRFLMVDLRGDGILDAVTLLQGSGCEIVVQHDVGLMTGGLSKLPLPESSCGAGTTLYAAQLDADAGVEVILLGPAPAIVDYVEEKLVLEQLPPDQPLRGGTVADLDGDGIAEIVHVGPQGIVIGTRANGGVSFNVRSQPLPSFSSIDTPLLAADFDRDGSIDLVLLAQDVVFFRRENDGSYALAQMSPRLSARGTWAPSALAHDLDGDGVLDLARVDLAEGFISIAKGLGAGVFSTEKIISVKGFFGGPIAARPVEEGGRAGFVVGGREPTSPQRRSTFLVEAACYLSAFK